jgi:RNA polymerase sigma factor (sigma-70 family)
MDSLTPLVHSAANGDPAAWAELVSRFKRTIHATAWAHRVQDAEDIEQITWMRLVEHISRLREPEALGGWLRTTARRECLTVLRSREIPTDEQAERASEEAPALDAVIAGERSSALHAALEQATERERAIIRALASDPEPSYHELADALGIPHGSIGPTRQRCIERLRRDPRLADLA